MAQKRTGLNRFGKVIVVSAGVLAFSLNVTQAQTDGYLARAQVVGSGACPAIFVSFNSPLSFASSMIAQDGSSLRIRLTDNLSNPEGTQGQELIETYPILNVPGLGVVHISLEAGGVNPVLILRFDVPIAEPAEIVQAGESSIVLSGIAAAGSLQCGASVQEETGDDGDEDLAQTFAEPDALFAESGSAQAEIDGQLQDARAAITAQEYATAAQILTKLVSMPEHSRSADVQELLGVARERNGQLAHAQAEYEIYLENYPDAEGADRVRQRLAALLTAASAPRDLRAASNAASGPIAVPTRTDSVSSLPRSSRFRTPILAEPSEPEPTFSASLSSYFYLNQGSTVLTEFETNSTTSDSDVYNNTLVTSLDMSDSFETGNFNFEWRVAGDYELSFEDSANNRLRFSRAYGDVEFGEAKLVARFGRQTRYDGGIFGRFDGAMLTWPVQEKITAKFTAGLPVNSSADDFFSSERTLIGASVEYAEILPGLTASAYFVHQNSGTFIDRQAIGVEAQFQNDNTSAFALVDFDTYFGSLNTVKASGTRNFEDQSSFTVSLDYSRSPLLSLSNALQGQTETTLAALNGIYTTEEMMQFALDRSAVTKSATFVYSRPVTDTWTASFDASVFHTAGSPASGGVPEVPETGLEYYISAQMVGNGVLSERDVVSLTARYADTASSTLILLDGYRRFQMTDEWRINTRLKLGHRTLKTDGTEVFVIPSMNATYKLSDMVDFELELGSRLGFLETSLTSERSTEFFMFAGVNKQF